MRKLYVCLFSSMIFFGCKEEKSHIETKAETFALNIVYNVLVDEENDDYEIYVMDFNGDNKRNICNSPGVDWAYHVYDDKVYFLSDRDTCYRCFYLYETNINGDSVRRVADFKIRDSWISSRNEGTELVVSPHKEVDSSFYIINLQGDIISKVYTGLPYFNDPCFGPDGESLIFRGSDNKFEKDIEYKDELFTINVDGTGLRQLTNFPLEDTTAQWHNYHAGPPEYVPANNNVSYISKQNGSYSIFTVDLEEAKSNQLTSDGFNQGWHSWSPDGNYVVFDGSSLKENSNYDIYLMDIEARKISRLTLDTLFEQAPLFIKKYEQLDYD